MICSFIKWSLHRFLLHLGRGERGGGGEKRMQVIYIYILYGLIVSCTYISISGLTALTLSIRY